MKWFRWYRGTSENPKFALVARRANKPGMGGHGDRVDGAVSLTDVLAVWCVILEDAGNPDHWGTCEKDQEFIAAVLQWDDSAVASIMEEMVKIGLLDPPINGGHHVAKWERYQYSSDRDPTNAARQRRFSNRQTTTGKRPPNALPKRPDTDTDTDTDTEKESDRTSLVDRPRVQKTRAPKRRTQLPDNFPDEEAQRRAQAFWMTKQRPDLAHDVHEQSEQFRDHHLKRGETMADWSAAWRTWQRNALKYNHMERQHGNRGESRLDNTRAGVSAFVGAFDAGSGTDGFDDLRSAQDVAVQAPGHTSSTDHENRAGAIAVSAGSHLRITPPLTGRDKPEIPDFLRRSRPPAGARRSICSEPLPPKNGPALRVLPEACASSSADEILRDEP